MDAISELGAAAKLPGLMPGERATCQARRTPHTGAMRYADGVEKIPAAALSNPDADLLDAEVASGKPVTFRLKLGAHVLPDVETAITLACHDLKQSKVFYADGLGFQVDKSFGKFASFKHDDGATMLSLYAWDALADDAGVAPSGDGFRGIALSYVVTSTEQVDQVLRAAAEAGASTAGPTRAAWGGYSGYFTDPSGHLWKVAAP